MAHVYESLPDGGQQQLDVPQAGPVQVSPHLQLAQDLKALTVDVLWEQRNVISISVDGSSVVR